jgi:hypothetical protein
MTRWNRPQPTTNWSSSSTRSSSTPTTRRCPTSTSSRCRASSRPASASASTARCSPTSRCRRISARPWSRGSRSCATSTSPSAASRRTARSSSRNTGRSTSSCGSPPFRRRRRRRRRDAYPGRRRADSARKLGLTPHNKERLEKTVTKPYGLFYVCGPTGSGKTTTLHSILKFLNTPDTKIWTAEDPVEITQKGLRQVQINKKAGIDFALVMRAFLRADPDIIMVGESRDKETVSMGVEASLTGHLVFSTLHTNSAPESITRLMDMGMDPFNFADALLGILAQRLAKKLCDCKESYVPGRRVAPVLGRVRRGAAPLQGLEGRLRGRDPKADRQLGPRPTAVEGQLAFVPGRRLRQMQPRPATRAGSACTNCWLPTMTVKKLIQERARVAELFAAGRSRAACAP